MAKLLFNLRNVPDDEADDIRAILTTNGIDYYETSAGRWGISVAAIWLKDNTEYTNAQQLISEYETRRAIDVRTEHQRMKAEGRLETFADRLKQEPIKVFLYLVIVLIILYFSITPLFNISSK